MTEQQKKRYAEKTKRYLAGIFGIGHYNIELRFRYEENLTGSCSSQIEYEQVVININLEENATEEIIRSTVLHEMVHVIGWDALHVGIDLAKSAKNKKFAAKRVTRENERVTTAWTRILLPLVFNQE